MKKRVLIRLGGIVVLVFSILGVLMIGTTMPNENSNGFSRKWLIDGSLSELGKLSLVEPLNRIVGVSDKSIFVASESFKGTLIIKKDFNFKDTLVINYQAPSEKMTPFSLSIDTPMLYLHVNNMRSIVYGKFPEDTMTVRELKCGLFTTSVQVSQTSMIVRSLTLNLSNQIFQKVDIRSGQVLKEADFIKLNDRSGGMSSEGIMVFDKESDRVFFVELYRNRIYCIDTSLNLIYQRNTIDTMQTNQIQLKKETVNDTTSKYVPNIARIVTNLDAFCGSGKLFIMSGLRSDDQSISDYNGNYNFDVYSTLNGDYIGSFKIKRPSKKVYKSCAFFNDTLALLLDGQLSIYRFK